MLLTPTEVQQGQARVEALAAEVRGRAARYEAAQAVLNSPRRAEDVRDLHAEVHRLVRSFSVGDSGEKAIAILARAAYVLERVAEPERVVASYEELQRMIETERLMVAEAAQRLERRKPER